MGITLNHYSTRIPFLNNGKYPGPRFLFFVAQLDVSQNGRKHTSGWDHGPYFDPESSFGGAYTRHGCFGIEGVDLFDCNLGA